MTDPHAVEQGFEQPFDDEEIKSIRLSLPKGFLISSQKHSGNPFGFPFDRIPFSDFKQGHAVGFSRDVVGRDLQHRRQKGMSEKTAILDHRFGDPHRGGAGGRKRGSLRFRHQRIGIGLIQAKIDQRVAKETAKPLKRCQETGRDQTR